MTVSEFYQSCRSLLTEINAKIVINNSNANEAKAVMDTYEILMTNAFLGGLPDISMHQEIINTTGNSLVINDEKITMSKKFLNVSELHFRQSAIYKSLSVPIESGDFYIEKGIQVTPEIMIPSGVYHAKDGKTLFPLVL